jgi:hypothetical protein
MQRTLWPLALALPLIATGPASAEILKGVLFVRGAEMS